jgi:CheY-like chemotaxis protein
MHLSDNSLVKAAYIDYLTFPYNIIMKIFYADDDAEDREIFCDAIQQINPAIKVVLSKDGQEALEILSVQKQVPDFIFLDINMPKVNGIECLTKLKSDDRLKAIPVIIYSTTTDSREIKKLLSLGADEFISKSNSFERLKESLHKVLTKKVLVTHQ